MSEVPLYWSSGAHQLHSDEPALECARRLCLGESSLISQNA